MFFSVEAQQIVFEKTYGLAGQDEWCRSAIQTSDGGYILAGDNNIPSIIPEDVINDIWIVKTDANGDTLWTRTFGANPGVDYGNCVRQTADGGYIIAGSYSGTLTTEAYLIKLDADGNTQWTSGIQSDNASLHYARTVEQTSDGGYFIAGYTGSGLGEIYIVKTNSSGDSTWTRYFHPDSSRAEAGLETYDGGFAVVGGTNEGQPPLNPNVILFKTDANGALLWEKLYGDTLYTLAWDMKELPDHGFIILAQEFSINGDLFLIRTDEFGDTLWTKFLYNTGVSNMLGGAISLTDDGGFIITSTGNTSDAYIGKTDALGNLQWQRSVGGLWTDHGWSVQQTADGGFILGGASVTDTFTFDFYLVKLDSVGCIYPSAAFAANTQIEEAGDTVFFHDISVNQFINDNPVQWLWQFGDDSTSAEQNPAHVYQNPGTYSVTLIVTNMLGCSDTVMMQDYMTITIPVSINEKGTMKFKVFPNPFHDKTQVLLENCAGMENLFYTLTDLSGRKLLSEKIADNPFQISRGNLSNGLYFFRAGGNEGIIASGKLLID